MSIIPAMVVEGQEVVWQENHAHSVSVADNASLENDCMPVAH